MLIYVSRGMPPPPGNVISHHQPGTLMRGFSSSQQSFAVIFEVLRCDQCQPTCICGKQISPNGLQISYWKDSTLVDRILSGFCKALDIAPHKETRTMLNQQRLFVNHMDYLLNSNTIGSYHTSVFLQFAD